MHTSFVELEPGSPREHHPSVTGSPGTGDKRQDNSDPLFVLSPELTSTQKAALRDTC